MQDNQRRFIRVETSDLIEVRPADGGFIKKVKLRDVSLMGICFYCPIQWNFGQSLSISYAVPGSLNHISMRVKVMWSELIDEQQGYLVGTAIHYINDEGIDAFARYYHDKLNELS